MIHSIKLSEPEDTVSGPRTATLKVVVDGRASKDRHITIPDPSEEDEIAWLVQKFPENPFAMSRGSKAEDILRMQTLQLKNEMNLEEDLPSLASGQRLEINIEIVNGPNIQQVHWELLETASLWGNNCAVRVMRLVHCTGSDSSSSRFSGAPEDRQRFRMLLAVARKCSRFRKDNIVPAGPGFREDSLAPTDAGTDIDYRLNSLPLFEILNKIAPGSSIIDHLRPATYSAFLSALQKEKYDLVHLDMHGIVVKNVAHVKFLHPDGGLETVAASTLAGDLCDRGVKLVFLNACESAVISNAKAGSNLAASLIEKGIPCVIGMAYEVTLDTVRIFQRAFYKAYLAEGMDAARATCAARLALQQERARLTVVPHYPTTWSDFFVPILYQREDLTTPVLCPRTGTSEKTSGSMGPISNDTNSIVGRDREVFELERHLTLRSNIGIVFGFCGSGKDTLLRHLSWWWLATGFVHKSITIHFPVTPAQFLDLVRKETNTDETPTLSAEEDVKHIVEYLSSHRVLLLIKRIKCIPPWLVNILEHLHGTCCQVLMSSDDLQNHFPDEGGQLQSWIFRLHLRGLAVTDGAILLTDMSDSGSSSDEKDASILSRRWRQHEEIVHLLQGHPLAITLARDQMREHAFWDLYWNLLNGSISLSWEYPRLQKLRSSCGPIFDSFPELASCLLPFPLPVAKSTLLELARGTFPKEADKFDLFEDSLIQNNLMVKTGTAGTFTDPEVFCLHPLFSQYLRSFVSPQKVQRIWQNIAIHYHNRALKLAADADGPEAVIAESRTQWRNIFASLDHSLQGFNGLGDSRFDFPWLYYSTLFSASPQTQDFSQETFIALTTRALKCVLPEYSPHGNLVWYRYHQLYVTTRSKVISDADFLRVIVFCLFLVDYYYDVALESARCYNEVLQWSFNGVELKGRTGGFEELQRFCKCISMLIDEEIMLETEPKGQVPMKQFSDLLCAKDELSLSSDRKEFIEIWTKSILARVRKAVPRLDSIIAKKARHLRKTSRTNKSEMDRIIEPLEDMNIAAKALNAPRTDVGQYLESLQKRLREATRLGGDTRRQLGLFEKLMAVYGRLGDHVSQLALLGKIDEAMDEIVQMPGFRKGDRSHIDYQMWIESKRATSLRALGKEYSQAVEKLRYWSKLREAGWTREERSREGLMNTQEMVNHQLSLSVTSCEKSSTEKGSSTDSDFENQEYEEVKKADRNKGDEEFFKTLKDIREPWMVELNKTLNKYASEVRYDVAKVASPPGLHSTCFVKEARHLVFSMVADLWNFHHNVGV